MSTLRRLIGSSGKMAVATLLSRVLGLVREQVLAAKFGATGLTDAFTIAFRLPNMLRDLFAEGAFSSAFVPVFTEERLTDPLAARRLLWSLFILLGSITTVIAILIFLFARPLLHFITDSQFTADLERVEVTVQLIRVMAPFLVFVSLAALFMGALNTLRVFFVPALAPACFNIIMIACMIYLPSHVERWGFHPIFSLGVGVLVGGFIQMLIQLPMIFKLAYGPMGPISFFNRATGKIVNRLGVGTIGIAATQINILITTMLATSTVIGAVSWLNYAFRLFQFPIGILSVSIANSNLVHFSEAWKGGRFTEAKEIFEKSYLLSMATIIPATALMLALAPETVQLIFERGKFGPEDTYQTSLALMAYAVGVPFYGLFKMLVPTFFALDKPKLPVFISVTSIAFNLVFCIIFVGQYGFVVLALGTSLSMLLNCSLQVFFLKRELNLPLALFFQPRLFKFIAAGLVCFATAWWLAAQYFDPALSLVSRIGIYSLAVGLAFTFYSLMLLGLGEGQVLFRALRRQR
jgi:putative peptidoglycan lipid II flippase